VVRLRCGRCRRVLDRLERSRVSVNGSPDLVTRWAFSDTGTTSPHCGPDGRWDGDVTIAYQCGCGARPCVNPGKVAAAATRAHETACRDLYTDLPHYGLQPRYAVSHKKALSAPGGIGH
jgi:hypothetical protein